MVLFRHSSSRRKGKAGNVESRMNSLAEAMTNNARSTDTCGGAFIEGTQSTDEVYLKATWVWLIPTSILLILCCVFFVPTIWKSKGHMIWKSSPLAYIVSQSSSRDKDLPNREFFPPPLGRSMRNAPLPPLNAIEKTTKGVEIRFRPVSDVKVPMK